MMRRSLHSTVYALRRIIFCSLLLSGAIAIAQGPTFEQKREPSQPPIIHPEPFVKPPLVNRQFTGEIRRILPQEVEVHIKEAAETVTLHMRDEWTRQLKLAPGAVYGILAHQRHTPGGITTAVKFKDERGLYALAETIHDVPLFTPHDRDGLIVEQHPEGAKTFVYEDACKAVYNVPVEFNVGRDHLLLQPHETKIVELSGKPYTVTLNTSQFIVLKECSMTFEGGRSQLDYSMVRAENGEK
jgi:hypothetical protein